MIKIENSYSFTQLMKEQHILDKKLLKHQRLFDTLCNMAAYARDKKLYDEKIIKDEDTGMEVHHISYYISNEKMFMKFMTDYTNKILGMFSDYLTVKGVTIKEMKINEKNIKKMIEGLSK